jgi:UDP-N-acetyl-D-glucosamine dehydrogenase
MPRHVVERISLMLNEKGKSVRSSKILGIGAAYKGGTGDTRGSAGEKILGALARMGAKVSYHDPLVPELDLGAKTLKSLTLSRSALHSQDLVVILVPQSEIDWNLVAAESTLVLDCCNALGRVSATIRRF